MTAADGTARDPTGPAPPTGRVAALGDPLRVQGFGLAGAVVVAAATPEATRSAWGDLSPDVVLVILTPAAARALAPHPTDGPHDRLIVVMPE